MSTGPVTTSAPPSTPTSAQACPLGIPSTALTAILQKNATLLEAWKAMGQVNPGSLPPDSPDMIRRQDLATQAQANIVLLASLTDHAGSNNGMVRVRKDDLRKVFASDKALLPAAMQAMLWPNEYYANHVASEGASSASPPTDSASAAASAEDETIPTASSTSSSEEKTTETQDVAIASSSNVSNSSSSPSATSAS